MDFLEFLEKSNDILPKLIPSSETIRLMIVSKKFKDIIERYKPPANFTMYYFNYKKKSEEFVKYLDKNKNILNFVNFTWHYINVESLKELFEKNILPQYKNITKFEFFNIELDYCELIDEDDDDNDDINNTRINIINILCDGLLKFSKLIELNLSNNHFEPIENNNILNMISKLTLLKSLNLYDNNINDINLNKEVKNLTYMLPNALLCLTNLRELNLGRNYIGYMDVEGVKSFIKILPNLKSLIYLNISNNNFCEDGIKILIKGLSYLTNLKILDISSNYIGSKIFYYLVDVLYNNCNSLIDLNISKNDIGRGKKLFEILNVCNTLQLQYLDISDNNIGSYIDIDISNNNIGSYIDVDINIDLNINTSLEYLNLRLNCYKLLEISKIPEIIKKYKALKHIKLYDYNFDEHKEANELFNKIKSNFPSINIDINSDIEDNTNSLYNYSSDNEST